MYTKIIEYELGGLHGNSSARYKPNDIRSSYKMLGRCWLCLNLRFLHWRLLKSIT